MTHHRIVLVRHARAAPTASSDLLRPLVDDGFRQAREQGERLRELGPFGPVLCSPATRCIQTAHELIEGLGREDIPEVVSDLSESSGARALLEVALAAPAGTIFVSHQPNLSDLACALLQSSSLPFALPPATAVLLSMGAASAPWSVAQVLPPP